MDAKIKELLKAFSQLITVHDSDTVNANRRKTLAILLVGIICLTMLIMLSVVIRYTTHSPSDPNAVQRLYGTGLVILVVTSLLYFLNRSRWNKWASPLFMGMWVFVLPYSDVPNELINGRSLFVFMIPIVISSLLIQPSAPFFFALTSSSTLLWLSPHPINIVANVPAMFSFFLVATISWLSASSLEQTGRDLLRNNKELDQRVIERTQELTEALARERVEAGKNQAILESITDGVVVFDTEGRAILVNQAMKLLIGRPEKDILGSNIVDLISVFRFNLNEDNVRTLRRFLQQVRSSADYIQVQWGNLYMVINVAPVITAGGKIIGRVVVFHNYTQQAEIDRMKNEFVTMVSHELRTPLNSVLGHADMLREGVYGKLASPQLGVLERMTTNTRLMLSIVNDLLDEAQIEAGRLIFHYRQFRPAELINHMNSMVEGSIEAKGLDRIVHVADDLPPMLYGDPQRLGQVLVNLVNNAVKFTHTGCITVRISRLDAEHWAMEVSDTGIGIAPEMQNYVFDSFRKVKMEPAYAQSGMGLGLAIVKRLVSLMQGEVCLNSQVGKGSTFTVILPFKPDVQELDQPDLLG